MQQTRRMLCGGRTEKEDGQTITRSGDVCGRHNSNIIIPQYSAKKRECAYSAEEEEIITNRRGYVAVLKETYSAVLLQANTSEPHQEQHSDDRSTTKRLALGQLRVS